MSEGVELTVLCCPTCGDRFSNELHYEADQGFVMDDLRTPTQFRVAPLPYLVCVRGHKWTVKTVWRSSGRPDEVLLGDYLGEAR